MVVLRIMIGAASVTMASGREFHILNRRLVGKIFRFVVIFR